MEIKLNQKKITSLIFWGKVSSLGIILRIAFELSFKRIKMISHILKSAQFTFLVDISLFVFLLFLLLFLAQNSVLKKKVLNLEGDMVKVSPLSFFEEFISPLVFQMLMSDFKVSFSEKNLTTKIQLNLVPVKLIFFPVNVFVFPVNVFFFLVNLIVFPVMYFFPGQFNCFPGHVFFSRSI